MSEVNMNKELQKAAQPLVDFLYKYGNPHCSVIVTQADAELLAGTASCQFD